MRALCWERWFGPEGSASAVWVSTFISASAPPAYQRIRVVVVRDRRITPCSRDAIASATLGADARPTTTSRKPSR
jgi:hypothetical protein